MNSYPSMFNVGSLFFHPVIHGPWNTGLQYLSAILKLSAIVDFPLWKIHIASELLCLNSLKSFFYWVHIYYYVFLVSFCFTYLGIILPEALKLSFNVRSLRRSVPRTCFTSFLKVIVSKHSTALLHLSRSLGTGSPSGFVFCLSSLLESQSSADACSFKSIFSPLFSGCLEDFLFSTLLNPLS